MNKILFCFLLLTTFLSAHSQIISANDNYILTNDSVRLFVRQHGQGPVCIFIHGGPGAWSQSFEQLGGSNLERGLSMIYYDQRGCGRSEAAADENYSLNRMVEDLETVRRQSGVDSVYLMAHSFGGILALNYALKYPSHVKGIILLNATLDLTYSLKNQIAYMNGMLRSSSKVEADTSLVTVFKQTQAAFADKGLIYKILTDSKRNFDTLNEIDSKIPGDFDFAKRALFIKDYFIDFTALTGSVKAPVLIIAGTQDHAIGQEHYKDFHFINQTVKKIAGGHLLYYEHNKEFVQAVLSFISRHE